MAATNAEGTVTTLTREDEIAAVRAALANVLGEAVGDLDATAEAVVTEMDRIATEAYEAPPPLAERPSSAPARWQFRSSSGRNAYEPSIRSTVARLCAGCRPCRRGRCERA